MTEFRDKDFTKILRLNEVIGAGPDPIGLVPHKMRQRHHDVHAQGKGCVRTQQQGSHLLSKRLQRNQSCRHPSHPNVFFFFYSFPNLKWS